MNDIPRALPIETIEVDTACLHCGYNLRGLRADGLCPECGSPIGRSVLGNFLRYSDVTWLQAVGKGTTVKLWVIGLSILLGAASGVAGTFGAAEALVLPAVIVSGLGLWGAWLITTQEPRMALHEDPVTLRKAVRLCAVLAFFGGLVSNSQFLVTDPAEQAILLIVGSSLSLAGIVQLFGELVYYRRFARRVPDDSLERSTTAVLWGLPISYAVLGLGGLVIAVLSVAGGGAVSSASGPVFAVGGGLVCLGGVAALAFGIWNIVLLFSYRRVFQMAAREATHWQHAGNGNAVYLR
jgi:hypothetical protein